MTDPVETSELLAFAKAVDAKSIARAAAELGVPRATISRRLARLEERLGVRLLRRTSRSLAVTEAGEAFHAHARLILDAVSQAEASVSRSSAELRGSVRVSVPPMVSPSFHAMTSAFAQRHPGVRLHVQASSQYVDLQRDGYDVALRAGTALEPGLIARTLARIPSIAVASGAYLAGHGTPRTARDLRDHLLLLGFARGELMQTHWPLLDGGKIQVEGRLASNDVRLLREWALDGLGIALVPETIVGRLLEQGALVHVLPEIVGAMTSLSVVHLERQFVPPAVRAFIDALVAWAPDGLLKDLDEAPPVRAPRSSKPPRSTKPRRSSKPRRAPRSA